MFGNPYPDYKSTGVEWLARIPSTWNVRSLKLIYDVQLGKMLQPRLESQDDVEVPYIKALHVTWQGVNTEELPTMWASKDELQKYAVQVGDLLVCEGGEVGRASIVESLDNADATIIQNAVHRIRSETSGNVRYLKYVLESIANADWFSVLCNKATIAHLTSEKLGAIRVPNPPICEQQKIVEFLEHKTSQIDALIEKKRALIEKLNEKRTAVITQAVTKGLDPNVPLKDSGVEWLGEVPEHWEVKRLKQAVTFQRGHDLTSDEREAGNVPVITSGGFTDTHAFAKARGPGLVTGRYGTIGKFHYVAEDYWPHNTTLYSIDLCGNDARYLWYLVQHLAPLFILNSKKSAVPGVDRNDLHPVSVAIPPAADEQRAIVDYLETIVQKLDKIQAQTISSIALLQERRTALITAAVTGQIDVRDFGVAAGVLS